MRALVIDDEVKERVAKLRTFSELPENYYLVGPGGKSASTPGNDPQFVCFIPVGYRCVFTITKTDKGLFRHLSISVPADGKYPNPIAAYSIAELFGFYGWDGKSQKPPEGWIVAPHHSEPCIILVQPINSSTETSTRGPSRYTPEA